MRRAASRPNTAPARIEREAGAGDAFRVVVRVRPENEQEANGPFRKVRLRSASDSLPASPLFCSCSKQLEALIGLTRQVISVLDEHMLVFDPSVDEEEALDEPRGGRPRMLQRKARCVCVRLPSCACACACACACLLA